MLKATFGFARLALSKVILINGVAATALMAGNPRATTTAIMLAMVAGSSSYVLFFSGCFAAAGALVERHVQAGHTVQAPLTPPATAPMQPEVSDVMHFTDGRLVEWLTALGTSAAAGAAVWLGLRQDRVKLLATADLWRQGDPSMRYSGPDTLVVSLANAGSSRITIATVYWHVGLRRPDVIPASVGGSSEWQPQIEPKEGADTGVLLNDLMRTLIPTLREHGGRARRMRAPCRTYAARNP
jgi:hypothetical protein